MNLFALVLVVSILFIAVLWVVRKLISPQSVSAIEPDWLDEFSIEKYRPMLRLLATDDYDFLAMQAGQSLSTIRKLRRERRKIFRAYLRSLAADFQRLHLAGKMLLVYSTEDRSEFASRLFQQKITFSLAMLNVHFHLALHTLGFGIVDVRTLLGSVESLRVEVSSIQPGLA